jgi:hypothetical protein
MCAYISTGTMPPVPALVLVVKLPPPPCELVLVVLVVNTPSLVLLTEDDVVPAPPPPKVPVEEVPAAQASKGRARAVIKKERIGLTLVQARGAVGPDRS